ncbi:uncharacterized protein PGTG_06533 [Puccinia graminis f. sp. tritici CRL 75-36-700-3]|uniref:Uncharacterized protein n=1 Tax=Puccinia graminis f. sp. tritici (strain CRL 75-36-700-3 / race SCCL) TaxID=418459 RepID=E3K940_PUCGT|nr:uncharacterized protein PGTG_06533 [Puccinia graminis f. sp. tritici CRL 75-36-700-3]EFP80577.2 hypothetical protein PGTG_06533 [Puccinia graminis f. sp. tritici CRL 75-36-700-3]
MHRPLFLTFSWCCALVWAADPDPLRSHPLSSSWWDHEYDCDSESEAAWIPAHQLLASFSTSHLQLSLPPAQLSQSTALSLRRAKAKLPPAPSFVPSSTTTTTTTSSFFQHGSPSLPSWKLSTSVSNPTPSPSSPSSATPALATRTFHTLEAISSHLLAPNEVHDQDHPDSQTPIAIENLMNEMRQIITNSGSEHDQAGSSQASKGTPVRQPLASISSDSAQREAQEKAATIQQLLSSPNHLSLFTENGNIWTLLLKRYHRKFVHEVLSIEFDDQPVSPQIETQRDLSFVMVSRSKSGGPTGFTYRILCHGGRVMQGSNGLIKLAKALLKTIHKLHEIILNKPGHISSFVHYSRQEKLLEWLHALIFSDQHGAPLIGIRKNIDSTWRKGDELGQAKLLLIHYFGQVLIEPQLLISTAYDLIKLFMAEDGFNYLPPTRPFGHSTDLPTDPYFEARERILYTMTEKSSKKYSMLFRSRNNFTGDDPTLRASIGEFEKACPREEMTNLYQSNHPRLSVIMYFLDKEPRDGPHPGGRGSEERAGAEPADPQLVQALAPGDQLPASGGLQPSRHPHSSLEHQGGRPSTTGSSPSSSIIIIPTLSRSSAPSGLLILIGPRGKNAQRIPSRSSPPPNSDWSTSSPENTPFGASKPTPPASSPPGTMIIFPMSTRSCSSLIDCKPFGWFYIMLPFFNQSTGPSTLPYFSYS